MCDVDSVLKDILLVVGSVVLLGSIVTLTQLVGYGIALAGLVWFKLPKETTQGWVTKAKSTIGLR